MTGSTLSSARKSPRRDALIDQSAFIAFSGVMLVIIVMAPWLSPNFLQIVNLENMTISAVAPVLTAIGVALVMTIGRLDLSSQAIASVGSFIVAYPTSTSQLPPTLAIAAAIAAGGACGLLNGLLVGFGRWHSALVTLLTSGFLVAGSLFRADGAAIPLPEYMSYLATPIAILLPAALVLAAVLQWSFGSNANARMLERETGWPVVTPYVICGLLSGLAGVVVTLRIGTYMPGMPGQSSLQNIAPGLLAGGAMAGSRCNIVLAAIAAILMMVLINVLNLLGISTLFSLFMNYGLVLAAVLLKTMIILITRRGLESPQRQMIEIF